MSRVGVCEGISELQSSDGPREGCWSIGCKACWHRGIVLAGLCSIWRPNSHSCGSLL